MPTNKRIIFEAKTWDCEAPDDRCTYKQDFDPNDAQLMALHFPGIPAGNCPACFMGKTKKGPDGQRVPRGTRMAMKELTDTSKKIKHVIDDPDDDNNYKRLDDQGDRVAMSRADKNKREAALRADLTRLRADNRLKEIR